MKLENQVCSHKFILYDDERYVFKNPKIKRDPFLMCEDCDYVNMSPTEKQLLDLRNKQNERNKI
jgi:hypothetical protein